MLERCSLGMLEAQFDGNVRWIDAYAEGEC